MKHDLSSWDQSGFLAGYSCINQLLSITREIHFSFNGDFEVRGFPYMGKCMSEKPYSGIFYALISQRPSAKYGVTDMNFAAFLKLLESLSGFLSSQKQRVVLNGQFSS